MQGRITEKQLPMAEECFPGIQRFYARLADKPATFLQLVWAFEADRAAAKPPRRRPTTRRAR